MIQFLQAEQQQTQYYFKVWMDTNMVQADNTPDPNFIREYRFPLVPPAAMTTKEYLDSIKEDIQTLVTYELNVIEILQQTAPIPLSGF